MNFVEFCTILYDFWRFSIYDFSTYVSSIFGTWFKRHLLYIFLNLCHFSYSNMRQAHQIHLSIIWSFCVRIASNFKRLNPQSRTKSQCKQTEHYVQLASGHHIINKDCYDHTISSSKMVCLKYEFIVIEHAIGRNNWKKIEYRSWFLISVDHEQDVIKSNNN